MFQLTASLSCSNSPCSSALCSHVLRIQHNLPEHLAFFHILVGRTDLLQLECPVYYRFQPSSEDVRQNFVYLAHRSHIGSENRQLPRIDKAQLNSHVRTGCCPTSHER